MDVWIHHLSYQTGWCVPVGTAICHEGFWVAVLCAYIAECVLRKALPSCNASCGGTKLKFLFIFEKLLLIFLISPVPETVVSGRLDDILNASMKPTQGSVLALWLALNYSILLALHLLDASILVCIGISARFTTHLKESPDNYDNNFRHSVIATLCFVFALTLLFVVRQFYNTMPAEMFSVVAVQFFHMVLKSLRVMLSADRPKEWKASVVSRFLFAIGSIFNTLELVLVVYYGFFIRGRVIAGVLINQIYARSRKLTSTVNG